MKCPNCSKTIKDKSVSYCPYCGQSLGNINPDLHEVTKIQIEYQEAKDKEKEWKTGGWICLGLGFILCVVSPITLLITLFIGIPLVIFSIVAFFLAEHYKGKAKKLKDEL